MICVLKQLQMNLVWVVSGQIKAAWEEITFSFNISLREYRFDPDKIKWQDTQTAPLEVSVIDPARQMQGEFTVGLGGDNNQCDGVDPFYLLPVSVGRRRVESCQPLNPLPRAKRHVQIISPW